MTDVLTKICDNKRLSVERLSIETPYAVLEQKARQMPCTRGFVAALKKAQDLEGAALIAEVKKASPSAGLIRRNFDAAWIAKEYKEAGATCLSVLTDEPYFQGSNADLLKVAKACDLPLLRKDFMIDPWQVLEARSIGADCILLIMAAIDDEMAHSLHKLAVDFGMDVLIEVHNHEELMRALQLPSGLIGINNRNLKTLKVDLKMAEDLAPLVPKDRIVVGESGLSTKKDLSRLHAVGVHSFLVGEALLQQQDLKAAVRALLQK